MEKVKYFKDCPRKEVKDCSKCANSALCKDRARKLLQKKKEEEINNEWKKVCELRKKRQQSVSSPKSQPMYIENQNKRASEWQMFKKDALVILATFVALAIFVLVMYFILDYTLGDFIKSDSAEETTETRSSAEILAEEEAELERIFAEQHKKESEETRENEIIVETEENIGMKNSNDIEKSIDTIFIMLETEAETTNEIKKDESRVTKNITAEPISVNVPINTEVSKPNAKYGYNLSEEEILLIAKVIHEEAVGEDFEGKVVIGAIILNRFFEGDDYSFERDSIWSVVTQPYQMADISGVGYDELLANPDCIEAARVAASGVDPTQCELFPEGALFWYNPEKISEKQALLRTDIDTLQFGNHFVHTELNWDALKTN